VSPFHQLLVYRFGRGARFEGQVVGTLERLEVGGAIRVLDLLFVGRDDSGELFGLLAGSGRAGGLVSRLLTFRLDPDKRRRATREVPKDLLDGLGNRLAPGEAFVVLLVSHEWARELAQAVARLGGTVLPSELVEHTTLTDAVARILDLARATP
jgi:hypothetical protein